MGLSLFLEVKFFRRRENTSAYESSATIELLEFVLALSKDESEDAIKELEDIAATKTSLSTRSMI